MKKAIRFNTIVSLLTLLFLLHGCSLMEKAGIPSLYEKPTFEYRDFQITEVSDKKISLELTFKTSNPGETDLEDFRVDYKLSTDNKYLNRKKEVKIALIPQGESEVIIPLEIVRKSFLAKSDTIPLNANIIIYGDYAPTSVLEVPMLIDFEHEMDVSINVSIPDNT